MNNSLLTFKQKVRISRLISNIVGGVLRGQGAHILMYHSIGEVVDDDRNGIYSIDEADFYSQMCKLIEMDNIDVVKLDNGIANPNEVIITFDDGFRDTYEVAAPILSSLEFPFTVFVSPGLIESNDKRYLDKQSLLKLSRIDGCNIGAHGYSHCRLTECSDKKLQNELEDSKTWLEDLLSIPVNMMSYPHGAVDQRVRDAAQSAGYEIATSSQPGVNSDKSDCLWLNRTDIWSIDDLKTFSQKVDGVWDWMRWIV